MRDSTFIGNNKRCEKFIEQLISKGFTETVTKEEITGMFEETLSYIREFSKSKGDLKKIYREYIQASPWSSGPYIFTALMNVNSGKPVLSTLWTDKEINSYL